MRSKGAAAHCVCVDCPEGWPYEKRLQEVIAAALNAESVDVPCVVEVCITDDEGIHATNLEMRGVDSATDVLSFPMFELKPGDKPLAEWADPDTDKVWLGDMMISAPRAAGGDHPAAGGDRHDAAGEAVCLVGKGQHAGDCSLFSHRVTD